MRPIASGLWIPSEALEGWRVQYRGVNPTNILATYTHEDPTPLIVRSTWQLDPIGNTIKGTLALTEHPYRDPFSFAARLELLAYDTYHPIWEGMFVSLDAESGGSGSGGLYALEFDSLQRKVLQKYWHGFAAGTLPPAIPQLNVNATHNLSGLELPDIAGPLEQGGNSNLMVKVSDVISKALEDHPDASWGVDAYRRSVLGKPQHGTPVMVPATACKDLSATGYEIPPYVTEARAYPPEGYAGFATSRPVPGFGPEVAQDGGQVELVEEVTASGMPIVACAVLDIYGTQPVLDAAGLPTVDPVTGNPVLGRKKPEPAPFGQSVEVRRVSSGYGAYLVVDPQTWYEQSALIKTNLSSYEPLSAKFTLGINIHDLPVYIESRDFNGLSYPRIYWDVVVDMAMWISESPEIDLDAVGPPDYRVSFNESPIHIRQSTFTIEDFVVKQSRDRAAPDDIERRQPIMDFDIEEAWFRQDQRPALMAAGWSGRFYVHMALTWKLEYPMVQSPYLGSPIPEYLADVSLLIFPPQFGQKVAVPPSWGAEILGLNYPFWHGPAFEGWVDGALVTPARITGSFLPSSASLSPTPVTVNQYCAGVEGSLEALSLRSSFKTGILPYQQPSRSYGKQRRT